MSDILLVILAVVFVLGIAINIHEFGHFIVAKLFGMRVEAYSFFGLGPRIWGFKVGHTDYRISAIPLGAYVKLYGDEATASLEGGSSEENVEAFLEQRNIGEIDEEKHAKFVVPESELYELRPRWQKFLVMLGGPFMNVVLALSIPFFVALSLGLPSMPAPIVGMVSTGGAAEQAGVKPGDRIVAVDGIENPTWENVRDNGLISPERDLSVTVERDGQRIPLTVQPKKVVVSGNPIGELGMAPDAGVEPVEVGMVVPGSAAYEAGLKPGDKVISYNGKAVRNSQELTLLIREHKDAPANLTIERAGQRMELPIAARADEGGVYRVGVGFGAGTVDTYVPATIGGAAMFAYETNMRVLRLTGKVFGQMFSGERSVKDAGLSGPVGIVRTIASAVEGDRVWLNLFSLLTAISLSLGIFNLLPIPLLDGGQIMVLGIEKVYSWFGATLSMAIREKIQLAGLGIILLLMVFTLFLDISRFF